MSARKVTVSASCHCKKSQYTFSVEESSLPFRPFLCSCNISRRISGVLFTSYVPVPQHNAPPNLSTLTEYKSSEVLRRYFCSTCGTHMFLNYTQDDHYEVSTGSLAEPECVLNFQGHMWVGDTRDGGASDWLPKLPNFTEEAIRWQESPGSSSQLPLDWKGGEPPQLSTHDTLHAHCHCGGVSFYISRPDQSSLDASSPYSDLLVPYNSGESPVNPDNNPWWLSEDGTRYLAGNCSCRSCRAVAGFDIVQWAFVPVSNISIPSGALFDRSNGLGTSKTYESSPGVVRHFCCICGADVFWDGSQRPSIVDVAVGLLDAESGARAEEWLSWVTKRVSFSEEGINRGLVSCLEVGLGQWAIRRRSTTTSGS